MEPNERARRVRDLFEQDCMGILEKKGHDYTAGLKEADGERDANANFKEVAKYLEGAVVDKYTVWAVYFLKQLFAIFTWLKDRKVRSEPLRLRIVDCINYLFILYTMLVEDGIEREGEQQEVPAVTMTPQEQTHALLAGMDKGKPVLDPQQLAECKSALEALGQGKGDVK